MRATSAGRAFRIRASRLNSERKRRDALSNAFADIRSMLPPDVQKMTKSRIVRVFHSCTYAAKKLIACRSSRKQPLLCVKLRRRLRTGSSYARSCSSDRLLSMLASNQSSPTRDRAELQLDLRDFQVSE